MADQSSSVCPECGGPVKVSGQVGPTSVGYGVDWKEGTAVIELGVCSECGADLRRVNVEGAKWERVEKA
jgi:hypothetical protein